MPETNQPKYQILPPLRAEEFGALKASIAEHGVEKPSIVDQHGNTLDGFHRERACDELGMYCPREVRHFGSEAEKYELILRLNCRRRQLNRQQKRDLIGAYLLCDPQIADNHLAELIGGISQNTVAAVRTELEATFQIEKLTRHRGRDGKDRPTKYKKIVANTAKETEVALSAIGNLPQNCGGRIIDCTTAKRRSKRFLTKQERQRRIEQITVNSLPDDIVIQHRDLRELKVPPASVDLTLTDVMWDEDSLEDWRALGRKAVEWLKPAGLLASYIGQHLLPRMANAVEEGGLRFQWIFNGRFEDQGNAAEMNGVLSRWRPVVVFAKNRHLFRKTIDTFEIGAAEKDWSHLQQTVQGTRWLLEHLSEPGDFIVDPCIGTGTTAVAVLTAQDGPRRFLGCDRDEQMVKIARHRVGEVGHAMPLNPRSEVHLLPTSAMSLLTDDMTLGCVPIQAPK